MKKRKSPRRKKGRQFSPKGFDLISRDADGIYIGASEHYVYVTAGSDPDGPDVRHFKAFTADLYNLAKWLKQCGVKTVAM